MKRVIAISSQVVRGRVGLSAICPALTLLGLEVLPVPTIVLSNHPGHKACAAHRIPVADLRAMLEALTENGLPSVDAILTGYLPTTDHVAFAAELIDCVKGAHPERKVEIIVDPVLGDDPKGLYIDEAAAMAICKTLIARADIITPNRFELSYLAGVSVTSAETAVVAARLLPAPVTVATSINDPLTGDHNLRISQTSVDTAAFAMNPTAPRGTGDTFAALYCAHHLAQPDAPLFALAAATAMMDRLVAASAAHDELQIVANANNWMTAPGAATTPWVPTKS